MFTAQNRGNVVILRQLWGFVARWATILPSGGAPTLFPQHLYGNKIFGKHLELGTAAFWPLFIAVMSDFGLHRTLCVATCPGPGKAFFFVFYVLQTFFPSSLGALLNIQPLVLIYYKCENGFGKLGKGWPFR